MLVIFSHLHASLCIKMHNVFIINLKSLQINRSGSIISYKLLPLVG